MEVRLREGDRLPREVMGLFGFIGTLIEVHAQFLREVRLCVSEDKSERNTQFDRPFEESVFLFERFAREGAFTFNLLHFIGRKWLYVFFASAAPRSHHGADTIGFKIIVIGFSGHLAEELDAGVFPHRSLVVRRNGTELLALDGVLEVERFAVVGHIDRHYWFLRELSGPVDTINIQFHG